MTQTEATTTPTRVTIMITWAGAAGLPWACSQKFHAWATASRPLATKAKTKPRLAWAPPRTAIALTTSITAIPSQIIQCACTCSEARRK